MPGSTILLPQYKLFLLELLHLLVKELERHKLVTISTDNLTEVASAMADVSTTGARINWFKHSKSTGIKSINFYVHVNEAGCFYSSLRVS